jgi:hypothetical protein
MVHIGGMRPPTPPRRLVALLLAAVATLSTAGCKDVLEPTPSPSPSASAGPGGGPTSAADARAQLAALPFGAAQSMAGYSRDRFPLWNDQGGGCDTRELVLKRDGTNVQTDAACHPISGHWLSVYDNRLFTEAKDVDIDHMVPLANAWRHGASAWTDAKRSAFANDVTRPQLLAVSPASNRAKGDQDPAQWKPPNHTYWCQYAQRWLAVKTYWQLTATQAEKTALGDMLGTC